MTRIGRDESVAERFVGLVMLALFWTAFAALAVGLLLWVRDHASASAPGLLEGGLLGLMALPALRLVAAMAAALRARDWLLLSSAIAVLAILIALTLRDALGH